MDNVTHTLVGALVGEAAARVGPRALPLERRRWLLVPTLAIGSNLPDIDLVYTTLVRGKLDYLLHHRGYTHTVLGALALSLLLMLIYEWRWRRRHHEPALVERVVLIVAALFGPLLHVGMDAANSYGVHPYWPFDNRWYYGDAIFIVEPLFWAAAAPLVLLLRSLWARSCAALALLAGIGLSVATRMVPVPLIVVYVAMSAAMLYVARRWPQRAAMIGVVAWLSITVGFVSAAHVANTRARELLAKLTPRDAVLDVMQSPMPMNPLCWELMLVQAPDAAHFTVRRAVLSLAPLRIPAASCPTRGLTLPISAPLRPVGIADSAALRWYGELTMLRAPLQALTAQHCEVGALMQFARIPWLVQHDTRGFVGDLRYDREAPAGFAEIAVDSEQAPQCPLWGAPWVPPRSELLQP